MIMKNVPDSHQNLLADETKALAFLATIMPDGSPQVTPVWFSTDGEHILINSAEGRVKDRNMSARPQVALTIMDLKEPYRYLQIRGKVVEITTEGGDEQIHALSRKYFGGDYTIPDGQIRKTYKVLPEKTNTME
jgi:PPOX class probable F420-dependent enzyme